MADRASENQRSNAPGKRPRGRPRIHFESSHDERAESADPPSPGSKRKTQVRLAQRAYRSRREQQVKSIQKKYNDASSAVQEMWQAWTEFNALVPDYVDPQMHSRMKEVEDIMRKNWERVQGEDTQVTFVDDEMTLQRERDLQEGETSESAASFSSPPLTTSYPTAEASRARQRGDTQQLLPHRERASVSAVPTPRRLSRDVQRTNELMGPSGAPVTLSNISIPTSLPNPAHYTYSISESFFHRRLHRACMERVFYLLSTPSQVTAEQVLSVLRIPLSYASHDVLRLRARDILLRGPDEALESAATRVERERASAAGAGSAPIGDASVGYNHGLRDGGWLSLIQDADQNVSDDESFGIARPKHSPDPRPEQQGGYRKYKIRWEGLDERIMAQEWMKPWDVEMYLQSKGVIIDGETVTAHGVIETVVSAEVAYGGGSGLYTNLGMSDIIPTMRRAEDGANFEIVNDGSSRSTTEGADLDPMRGTIEGASMSSRSEYPPEHLQRGAVHYSDAHHHNPQRQQYVHPQFTAPPHISPPPPMNTLLSNEALGMDLAFTTYTNDFTTAASSSVEATSNLMSGMSPYGDLSWLGLGMGGDEVSFEMSSAPPPDSSGALVAGASTSMGQQLQQAPEHHAIPSPPRLVKVHIDLDKLIEELLDVGFCLGVSPGFAKADIDAALTRAITVI